MEDAYEVAPNKADAAAKTSSEKSLSSQEISSSSAEGAGGGMGPNGNKVLDEGTSLKQLRLKQAAKKKKKKGFGSVIGSCSVL